MGVERGKCLNDLKLRGQSKPCPCPGYKISVGAERGACNLCECPSVMHEELEGNCGRHYHITVIFLGLSFLINYD